MSTEFYICLDLGSDTLKISYAYENNEQDVCGKLMLPELVNQVALPAVAFYDSNNQSWKFAEEIEAGQELNFSTVVKIKSLLALVASNQNKEIERKNQAYYREKFYFPQFSFPVRRKRENNFQYLVDQKLVFEAKGTTPMELCEGFFLHVKDFVSDSLQHLAIGAKLVSAYR